MKHLPSLAAEPADPLFCRGDCQWNKQKETGEARDYERALRDVLQNFIKREELVQPDVRDEVQEGVKEREEAKHSAEPYQAVPSGDASKRRDAQRDHQKA